LLDIGDRYMAAVWQRQAVLSEYSHCVDNVCQLVLLITIKDGKQLQLFTLGCTIRHGVTKNTRVPRTQMLVGWTFQ
jgi:hypothetical protein